MIDLYKKVLAEESGKSTDNTKLKTIVSSEGDTIEKIATRHRISPEDIKKHNPELEKILKVVGELPAGVEIKIPKDWHPQYDHPANFKQDFIDAKIVSKVQTYCFGNLPVVALRQIRAAAGALKGSFICGFTIKSAVNPGLPELKIIFCPKPRSKIYRRDDESRSRWYGMQVLRHATQYNILRKEFIYKLYGFDVDRFFECKEFKDSCAIFKKTILHGYKSCQAFVKDYKKKLKANKIEKDPTDDGNIDEWLVTIREAADLVGALDLTYEDKNYLYNDEQKILDMMSQRDQEKRDEIASAGAEQTQATRDKAKLVMTTIKSVPKYHSA